GAAPAFSAGRGVFELPGADRQQVDAQCARCGHGIRSKNEHSDRGLVVFRTRLDDSRKQRARYFGCVQNERAKCWWIKPVVLRRRRAIYQRNLQRLGRLDDPVRRLGSLLERQLTRIWPAGCPKFEREARKLLSR